jgi:Zn-dependent protease
MQGIDIVYLLIVFVSILISMTLHEAMHAFTSNWLGDDTAKEQGRLTLNPLAHIDPVTTVLLPLVLVLLGAPPFGAAKPVPFNPTRVRFGDLGAALVGLAGPLTNLLLAVLAGLALKLLPFNSNIEVLTVLSTFAIVNISFFVFNLIPFPPLDGSRALYALAPESVRAVMERIEGMGFMAIALFMVIFYTFLINPFIAIVNTLVGLILGR